MRDAKGCLASPSSISRPAALSSYRDNPAAQNCTTRKECCGTLGGGDALDAICDFADRLDSRLGRHLSDRGLCLAVAGGSGYRVDSPAGDRPQASGLNRKTEAEIGLPRHEEQRGGCNFSGGVPTRYSYALAHFFHTSRSVVTRAGRYLYRGGVAPPVAGSRYYRAHHPVSNREKHRGVNRRVS
jgi:hypothetical protein